MHVSIAFGRDAELSFSAMSLAGSAADGSESEEDDSEEASDGDEESEQATAKDSAVVDAGVSDMDYLKSRVKGELKDEDDDSGEEEESEEEESEEEEEEEEEDDEADETVAEKADGGGSQQSDETLEAPTEGVAGDSATTTNGPRGRVPPVVEPQHRYYSMRIVFQIGATAWVRAIDKSI